MSDAFQDDSSKIAKKRLHAVCRTKDTSVRLAWAITTGEAVLLGVLAVALVDYWLMLPVWIRTIAAAVIATLAVLGMFRLVRFFRRPTPLKEAALDVESAHPEAGCEISTAAEYLSGERQSTKQFEPELVAALEAKAAQELHAVQMPYQRRLVTPAVILFVTLLALLVFVVVAPVAFTALTRAALPFSKATYTQVKVTPGNLEIPVGHDATITNVFSGRPVKDPQLQWKEATAGNWQSVVLTTRSSDGAYLYTFRNLRSDVQFRVAANDVVSDDYRINTYVPPEVKDLAIRIEYPDYTKHAAVEQKSPDVSAVRASVAQVRIDPSTKLSRAKLRFANSAEEVPLHQTDEGLWTGEFKLTKDADYFIDLADLKGHRGGDEKPHHVKALPDAPPKVEIEDPGQDSHAAATNKLPVKISVADDFGVQDVNLVFHKLGAAPQVVPAKRETNEKGEITATAELDLSTLDLKDYELVEYHAEAKDNNTLDGPGIGKSPVYFVEITNLESGDGKKPPMPKPEEKVNLIVIQKQIIADTAALAKDAAEPKFKDLAARQADAKDFGQIYLDTLTGHGAPTAAVSEMKSAVEDMGNAKEKLGNQSREAALPPEESALAHLYQVLKQMPELENMPTQPKPEEAKPSTNQLAVVLEAIKEKKKEQGDDKAIEDALQQAQALAQAQSAINQAMRHPAQATGKGQGQGQGQAQGQKSAQKQDQKNQKNADAKDQAQKGDGSPNKGQGKGTDDSKGPQLAKDDQTDGKGQGQGKGAGDSEDPQTAKEDQKDGKGQGQGKGAADSKDQQLAKADQADGKGKGQGQGQGKGEGQNQQQQAQGKGKGKGKGQGQGQGEGQGKGKGQGQGQADGDGQPAQEQQEMAQDQPSQDPEQLAKQEEQLSQQAQELADKLERLAGNDKRIGHNAGQHAKLGGQKIAKASDDIKQGNFGAAGVNGFQGELALRTVAAQLERIAKEKPELTDVASEEAPKQYEGLISEYFKKLSHAE
jgi:hypothetical protein